MKRTAILTSLLICFFQAFSQPDLENTALIIIDVQDFYFEEDKLPLEGNVSAAGKAAELIRYFRKNQAPIIHVRHKGGGDFHKLVKPRTGEKIIEKEQVNAFRDTDLHKILQELNIDKLVLAGMQTHMCLEAATRAADDYGFNCTVIHDACATRDLEFNGRIVKAADVHASTLSSLKAYSEIMSVEDYLKPRQK
jgi:nicotinamidase-related amidase